MMCEKMFLTNAKEAINVKEGFDCNDQLNADK